MLKPIDKYGVEYTGDKYVVDGIEVSEGLVSGHTVTVTGGEFSYVCKGCASAVPSTDGFSGEIEHNHFSANVTITGYDSITVMNGDKNVTDNYDIVITGNASKGTLQINPPRIIVDLYDMKLLYLDSISYIDEAKDGPVVAGVSYQFPLDYDLNVIVYSIDLRGVGVGTHSFDNMSNRFSYKVVRADNGEEVQTDFIVQFVGELVIEARPLTIKTNGATQKYNADSPLKCESAVIENLISTHSIKLNYTQHIGDPDESTSVPNTAVVEKITDSSGKDVTSNYNITYTYGTLTVTPRD